MLGGVWGAFEIGAAVEIGAGFVAAGTVNWAVAVAMKQDPTKQPQTRLKRRIDIDFLISKWRRTLPRELPHGLVAIPAEGNRQQDGSQNEQEIKAALARKTGQFQRFAS